VADSIDRLAFRELLAGLVGEVFEVAGWRAGLVVRRGGRDGNVERDLRAL
jgi:hypothetical protein